MQAARPMNCSVVLHLMLLLCAGSAPHSFSLNLLTSLQARAGWPPFTLPLSPSHHFALPTAPCHPSPAVFSCCGLPSSVPHGGTERSFIDSIILKVRSLSLLALHPRGPSCFSACLTCVEAGVLLYVCLAKPHYAVFIYFVYCSRGKCLEAMQAMKEDLYTLCWPGAGAAGRDLSDLQPCIIVCSRYRHGN